MYLTLLVVHNAIRWIVLLLLLFGIYRACDGYRKASVFSALDNALRHWTATVLQMQMMAGFVLYFNSPFVSAFWSGNDTEGMTTERFFAVVHSSFMFAAVTIISVGSALAKRRASDQQKYRTMLTWFCIGMVLILIAIPWPFSPLTQRPLIRSI